MNPRAWRILLIEDDEDDYLLTRSLLSDFKGRPFELDWAPTVEAAAQWLQGQPPDVILVDYALGAASGVEFIRQALVEGCPAPFILLTGHGGYDVDLEAMQAGAMDYLPKAGLTPNALERSIRYAIERNANERALRQAREELEGRVQARTRELQERSQQLTQANELLERVFSGIHLQVAYLDRDFNFLRVNQNYADANGQPPEYFTGRNHFELYPDEEAQAIFQGVVETGETYYAFARPFINRIIQGGGVSYWDWSLQPVKEPDGRVSGLVLSLLDVTGRERAARALRAREEQLRAVVTGAPVILWAVDSKGTITLLEGRSLEKLGLTPGELVGRPAIETMAASPEGQAALRRALAGEEGVTAGEVLDGVYFHTRFSPQCDAKGQVTGVIAISTDISERVQAEEQLAYQADLLDRVSDAIIASDEEFRLTTWNRAAEVIYGWLAEEVLGVPGEAFLRPGNAGAGLDGVDLPLERTGQFQGEVVHHRRDGQPIHVEMKATVLKGASGQTTGYASVNRDITERKRIQAELAEVQRRLLESVEAERQHIARELHDGPMQELYALAYEIEALRHPPPGGGSASLVDALQAKLRQVSQALRATATELRPPTLAPFGLEKAIRSHADGFGQEHPELKIVLELEADGQLLPERVRLALFRIYQQALTNVVRHANATSVTVRLMMNDSSVTLEIQDNGRGFEVPARWVELARGGHLGLVGAQERASAVGGVLNVLSRPGEGTLIRVRVSQSLST